MHGSSFSSRTVLSRTTLKFFLIDVGFARASCSAVVILIVLSFFEILRPTPQISSTGCSDNSFSIRFGLPEVRASTPPNCRHSLDAHCADFASVFVDPIPAPMVSLVPERTCSRNFRPKSSKSIQLSIPRISRNISSMEYCSTRGASSSRWALRGAWVFFDQRFGNNYRRKVIPFLRIGFKQAADSIESLVYIEWIGNTDIFFS